MTLSRTAGRATGSTSRPTAPGLLVKPDVASRQLEIEVAHFPGAPNRAQSPDPPAGKPTHGPGVPIPNRSRRRGQRSGAFTAQCEWIRRASDAMPGRIADEVIAHLAGQMGAEVTVTIEIEARLPNGATDQLVRTVTENSRTLKFDSQGFEKEFA